MARLYPIFFAAICAAAIASSAQAQAVRPTFPGPQPVQPNAQQQPGGQRAPVINPAQPPTAPLKPANAASEAAPPATPPTPPVVTYRDGLLTVQALNSTLSSVLTAIRNKTGIDFEGQENNADRVAISLGPAPAGEVLSAILTGSKYDFVALARPDDPNIVQRVILTPKSRPGAVANNQPQPQPANNGESDGEETPDETVNAEPQDTAAQPPVLQQPPQQPPQNQQPKTQEQLLQELQEMKQRQMQQEGAPTPNPGQVPRKPPL